MKNIIVIGSPEAQYHPLSNITELGSSLCGYTLLYTDNHDCLLSLDEYALLICYMDLWERPLSDAQAAALKEYLLNGGRVLSVHNGISIQDTPSLAELTGARFTDHPPMESLLIKPVSGHPVTDGLSEFTVFEEPYHFEDISNVEILAAYDFNGVSIPAAWERSYGKGILIYLMPGHDPDVFKSEQYRRLIQSCVVYLTSKDLS